MALKVRITGEIEDTIRKVAMKEDVSGAELVREALKIINWDTVEVEKKHLTIKQLPITLDED